MKHLKSILLMTAIAFNTIGYAIPVEKGVSKILAEYRAEYLKNILYDLHFNIPAQREISVTGKANISFSYDGTEDLQLDFQGTLKNGDYQAFINGKKRSIRYQDEHLIIPRKYLKKGDKTNLVTIEFESNDKTLNRNDDYLYTLFVPDHARSVFPCFDQPDLKALFNLKLDLPEGWTAISNGSSKEMSRQNKRTLVFNKTQLLPTYLFSFTAGKFEAQQAERDGRTLTFLYRETDPKKVAQLPQIFDEIALSLKWLEEYTGIPYPFEKYACVALPGYQFGGMEHPGCIQFRDATIFLGENPTPDERMNRLNLIAHETAHMWFGDLVTMRWFDDVWTKEVFANFMADKIAKEHFPEISHELNFIKTHYIPALSTDRTEGTHPIQQPLANLNQAGLLYGNIIYHKAPIMMKKLEEKISEEDLRKGLQIYLRKYQYSNSSWDELIAILDSIKPTAGIRDFDREWVKGKGVKTIEWNLAQGLPNYDGTDYARYLLKDSDAVEDYVNGWTELKSEQSLLAAVMTLYENFLAHRATAGLAFTGEWMLACSIQNEQILSVCASYLNSITLQMEKQERVECEKLIYLTAMKHPVRSFSQKLLRSLSMTCIHPEITDSIYHIWEQGNNPLLNERDYMRIAYHLMIELPTRTNKIKEIQTKRLSSEDRRKEFDFVSRGCTADTLQQRKLFESLLLAENRKIEPYASELLALLSDADRGPQCEQYVRPGLEIIEEIQRTGDIFFPLDWCNSLLSGQRSKEAAQAVRQFLDTHPELSNNLRGKILQAAFPLLNRWK